MTPVFTSQSEPRRRRIGLVSFAALFGLSAGLVAAAIWLEGSGAWRHPGVWLATLDREAALSLLGGAAQIVAGVLAILITVVAIILELSATRYTHRVTALFAQDPINIAVMTLFMLTTVLCIWLAIALSGEVTAAPLVPHGGFLLAIAMMTVCLVALLPYFAYVFNFVSPLAIIERIRNEALRRVRLASAARSQRTKRLVIDAMEDIEDVARSAMKSNDRGIAMAAIESLATLLTDVTNLRDELPDAWFRVDEAVARDPDFIAMGQGALDEIAEDRSWFEAKILRQYLALFSEAVGVARDVASMIAIHTRRLAEEFATTRPALLELCQRAFNSYLRAAINGADPRAAYFVMHQYRMLGEALLAAQLPAGVLQVARRLRFYGRLANSGGLSFLLEVAAYDLAHLVEAAADDGPIRDAILEVLLTIDDGCGEHLLAVRRAQIQLGTFLVLRADLPAAGRVARDLAGESAALLAAARDELEREVSPSYWEITDRGGNFSYLLPERRAQLAAFFGMIEDCRKGGCAPAA